MTSFIIGKVVDPELQETKIKGEKRNIFRMGILSGRFCLPFDIFDDSKVFEKAQNLEDGDLVIAVVGTSVDNKGNLRTYLNSIGDCPEGLREQLMSLIRAEKYRL